jgi:hypothetical protein
VGMTAASAMKFAVSGGVAGFHSDENIFKARNKLLRLIVYIDEFENYFQTDFLYKQFKNIF